MKYPSLNFPSIQLRARRNTSGRTEIYDRVRSKWLVLTPEEWVRQHVLDFLLSHCGFLPQQLIAEYPVNINGMSQRADIVAVGSDSKPYIVVECKEPDVKISDEVLRQVVRYNSILGCRYIVITNGIHTYCYGYDGYNYTPIEYFPKL
ncbi:MAG: type I restriction enzyme HsdR N-terminal domain-containing protein [Alistipes sp.]|nr:type I restriction enzyme HsdR N-terminal domain-containing protein [Alistipes sp.]